MPSVKIASGFLAIVNYLECGEESPLLSEAEKRRVEKLYQDTRHVFRRGTKVVSINGKLTAYGKLKRELEKRGIAG